MTNDPILAEVRKIKESRAAKFKYNVRAIAADAMRRQSKSARKIAKPVARHKSR